jgi:DNA invertase Pin-like site-specific DNA recombinase
MQIKSKRDRTIHLEREIHRLLSCLPEKRAKSGLGLEAQQAAVRTHLNGGKWRMVEEFTEVESGKRTDRPELAKALNSCRLRKATLLISKMDRLSRDAKFLFDLTDKGVKFIAVDNPNVNELTIKLLAVGSRRERSQGH